MNERGAISKRNVTVERDYYRFSFAGFHFRFSLSLSSVTYEQFVLVTSRRRSLEISRFLYRTPLLPPLEISRQTHLEISGAEIELETRVNEHYTAKTTGIDQVWAWSKRKVAIENKLGGVGALLFYSVG